MPHLNPRTVETFGALQFTDYCKRAFLHRLRSEDASIYFCARKREKQAPALNLPRVVRDRCYIQSRYIGWNGCGQEVRRRSPGSPHVRIHTADGQKCASVEIDV